MISNAPPLLPILRSYTQAAVLTVLLLNPDQELTLTDLAGRIDAPLSSVSGEVDRLGQAGIVTTRVLGRARLVKAAHGPLVEPLTVLVLRAFGPRQVIAEEFGELLGVERVLLFGSWAARYHGIAGSAPADIDVLIVVAADQTIDGESVYQAANRAERRLLRPVNPTVVSAKRWKAQADPLLQEITSHSVVHILPLHTEDSAE